MRRVLLLLVLPVALLAPALFTGALWLPQAPAGLEPLASEDLPRAAAAWRDANYLASDRLFPILSDELEIRRQLRDGHLPLWNAKQGLGLPLLGGTLVGPLYPPNWIAYATDPVRAGPWLAALSLLLAGLGGWLFLERRGAAFGAAAIGALALQGGGFALANLHYRMKVDAALWLAWTLWSIDGLAERRPRAGLCLAGSVALSFLAGFPTIAAFALAAAALYALLRRLLERAEVPLLRALGLAVAGVAIAAVQLVPTWDAARESLRGPRSRESLTAESLPLGSALGLAVPDLFGAPGEPLAAPHLPVPWWLSGAGEKHAAAGANALEAQLCAGVAVLALALAGFVARPRASGALGVLALAALGFAQGWPLLRELYRVPGLDLGTPARASAVLWIALALAAGLGADALLCGERRALATATAAAAVLALAGAAFRLGVEPERFARAQEDALAARHGVTLGEVRALLDPRDGAAAAERLARAAERVAWLGLAVVFAAGYVQRRRLRGEARAAWLPLLAILAVEPATGFRAQLSPRPAELREAFPTSPAMAAIAEAAGDGRVLRVDTSTSGVDEVLGLARPNLPEAYGVADLTPYVAFSQRRLVELVQALDPLAGYRTGISRLSLPARVAHPLLDALRATAILSREPLELPALGDDLRPVLERDRFHVYRRRGRVAPARIVAPRAVASEREALERLGRGEVDPERECVLVGEDAPPPDLAGARVLACSDDGAGHVEVELAAPGGGWLVLASAFHPGWRATIDGKPARVAPADHALLGIELPARDRLSVRAEFAPRSYALALVASLAGLAAAWLLARGARRAA